MRQSKLFTKTRKEAPKDEVSKNAQLLIRAGFVHKEMAGVYSFLPLGQRVLDKVSQIISEEMDSLGGARVHSAVLQKKEIWEKTDRWSDEVVDNWFKTELKNGTELGLSFTHEEPLTAMMKEQVSSYKDLPAYPYDIMTVFRNEVRAKSGVMRGREFFWKALYSFSKDEAEHLAFYEKITESYKNIFQRVGLGDKTHFTFASGGSFSKYSHEFQTVSDAGEDMLFIDSKIDRVYNREIAPAQISESNKKEEFKQYEEQERQGVIGVDDLVKELGIDITETTKTLIFEADGEIVVASVRGDYDVNELKLKNIIGCESLKLASEETIKEVTGSEVGYAGLVNLPKDFKVYIDDSIQGLCNFETGTNKTGFHSVNVNFGVDVDEPAEFYDFKNAKEGDINPESGSVYEVKKAIEVGNIFTLGEKFSEPLGLKYKDENGEEKNVFMGSYGIGISRLVGVIAETLSDEKGLVWPVSVAPFAVHLISLGQNDEADALYKELIDAGVEVLYDDRDTQAGEKFADSDLIGIPTRVVVSGRSIEAGGVEVKRRTEEKGEILAKEDFLAKFKK